MQLLDTQLSRICFFLFNQASDFSDVGDWPTLGEAAHATTLVRPKDDVSISAPVTGVNKSRTWADEVICIILQSENML